MCFGEGGREDKKEEGKGGGLNERSLPPVSLSHVPEPNMNSLPLYVLLLQVVGGTWKQGCPREGDTTPRQGRPRKLI